jgi:hypothetical protein
MMKGLLLLVLPLLWFVAPAQSTFEGTITVIYTSEKSTTVMCDIKAKGDDIYIKQNENGNPKYDRFVINLASRELYTISGRDKRVIIKYHLDSLLAYYSANKLKEGFELKPDVDFKVTDKTKKEGGVDLTRYVAESDTRKATAWAGPSNAPVNALIPFLRLLGNWNDAQGNVKGQILEADVSNKVSKKDSRVVVNVTSEPVGKEMFILPKTYVQKDFSKLMTEMRGSKDLKMIIQTFAEF